MELYRKGGPQADRIRRQAELLAAARHPGVVELIGVEGSADRPTLVTNLVDGPTLATPIPYTAGEVAAVVGAVATTLAHLHDMGIVHGAVTAEHVIVGPGGRPVLCGFGSAGRIGEAGPAGDEELHPSTDVAALGRLLRRLATGPEARALRRIADGATADDPAARPSARDVSAELAKAVPHVRLPDRPAGGEAVPDLRALVAGARSDRRRLGARRRPSAPPGDAPRPRRLAGSVGDGSRVGPAFLGTDLFRGRAGPTGLLGTEFRPDEVPDSGALDGLPGGEDPPGAEPDEITPYGGLLDPRAGRAGVGPGAPPHLRPPGVRASGRRRRRPPLRSSILAGGVGALAVVGLLQTAPWASSGPTPDRASTATTAPPATRVTPTSTTVAPTSSTRPTTRTDCPPPASVLVADVDGDGCLDALHYDEGVLESGGQRWAVGRAGDQVATGDWSCRGNRTIVLLRPSTGEIFRFDGWAVGAQESVTGAAVATVPGGQAVRAADVDRDGCHEVVVERGELPPQVVRLPRPPS